MYTGPDDPPIDDETSTPGSVWGSGLVVDHDFVEAHRSFLRRSLLRLGMPASDVDDGMQEVLLAAVSGAHRFEAGRSPRAWLYGIAVNITRSQRRRRLRFAITSAEPPEISVPPEQERRLESRAARSLIHRALDELPEEQRDVVVLHRLEGWPIHAVAEAVGCPVATAHSRLRLGTARLGRVVRGNVVRGRWAAMMAALLSAFGWPPAAAAATVAAVLVLGTGAAVMTLNDAPETGEDAAPSGRSVSATVTRSVSPMVPGAGAPAPEEARAPEPREDPPTAEAPAPSTSRPAPRSALSVAVPSTPPAPPAEPARDLASETERAPGAAIREATGGTVLEETQLLGRARTIALSSPEASRALLRRYDARFPQGVLRRERDAIAALLGE